MFNIKSKIFTPKLVDPLPFLLFLLLIDGTKAEQAYTYKYTYFQTEDCITRQCSPMDETVGDKVSCFALHIFQEFHLVVARVPCTE